jgi:hypothetical protein
MDVGVLKRTKILKLLIQPLSYCASHNNNMCSDIDASFNKRIDFAPTCIKINERVYLLVDLVDLTTESGGCCNGVNKKVRELRASTYSMLFYEEDVSGTRSCSLISDLKPCATNHLLVLTFG